MNNKLDDILKVLKYNDMIDKLYKKLTQLEIKNLKNSDEYINIVELINDLSKKEYEITKSATYYDEELNNIFNNISSFNNYSDDAINYINETNNSKIKRLLCHYDEISLTKDDFPEDLLTKEEIRVNGYVIPTDEALELIEEFDEDSAEYVREIISNFEEQMFETLSINNFLLYCRNALEHHTTAEYLEDAIANEKNLKIKNKLIEYKYKMISIYKYLEDPFLKNPNNYSRTAYYQEILKEYYNKYIEFFKDWDSYYEDQVNNALSNIMDNSLNKYTNINQKYYDKLLTIYLKVYSSISSSEKILNSIDLDKKTAIQLSTSDKNKNIIKNSLNLKQDLILCKVLKEK